MTRVTLITSFYNRTHKLRDSVRSLLDQDHDDLEILITDDGSTDETLSLLREFADPRLTVISQQNVGMVTSFNRMIERATGDYIAVHGSGDISSPERISKQAECLDETEGTVVVSCFVDEKGKIRRPEGWNKPAPQPLREAMMSGPGLFVHGETMFRKDVFDSVGGYRPLFRYGQDRDLWLRMGLYGGYAVVPEVLYKRSFPPDSVHENAEKVQMQRKLSAFAVQCAKSVDEQGRDLVDRFGDLALLHAEPSKQAAFQMTRRGMGFMLRGKDEQAQTLLKSGYREYRHFMTFIGLLLSKFSSRSAVWKIIAMFTAKMRANN